MKKEKLKKQSYCCQQPKTKHQTPSGITLVALVITIIILLILAGVAISMITDGEGLFAKVNNSAVKYEKESLREKLDLAIRTSVIDKMNFSMDIDDVTEVLIEKGHTAQDRLVKMDEKQIIMQSTPEGYLVEITQKEDGGFDIKVLDKGEIEVGAFVVGVEITTAGLVLKEVTEETDTTNEYEYYFSADNGSTWESNEDKTVSSYTYGTDKIRNVGQMQIRKVTSTGKIQIGTPTEFEFQYTGTYHPFVVQKAGTYQLEVYGASGGPNTSTLVGGKGGYAKGNKNCVVGDILYVYVGEAGIAWNGTTGGRATFNGGGKGGNGTRTASGGPYGGGGSGGGATDIRVTEGAWNDTDSLDSRIIVAGGGGGSAPGHGSSGAGGGESGGAGTTYAGSTGAGGTQTSGYAKGQGQAGISKSGVSQNYGAEGNGGRRWRILWRIFSTSYWIRFYWRRRWRFWLHRRSNGWNNGKWCKRRKRICKNNIFRELN